MENEVSMGKLSSLIRAAGGKKRFNSAVILAAGSGTRMNDDRAKQFIEVRGLPIVVRSALAFEQSPEIHEIVVVTRAADVEGCTNILLCNFVVVVYLFSFKYNLNTLEAGAVVKVDKTECLRVSDASCPAAENNLFAAEGVHVIINMLD